MPIDKRNFDCYNNNIKKEDFIMKKVRVLLVSLLTMLVALFCFVGCGQTGKYKAVSYKIGNATIEIEADDEAAASYVELKGDDVAVVNIKVATLSWEGTGTWEKAEEDKTVKITVGGITYTATIEGKQMTLNLIAGSIVLEK